MGRIFGILITLLLVFLLVYMSRFWVWQAPWGNGGLFGIKEFSPRGDVLRRFLRGSVTSPFDLLIWLGVAIAGLSVLQYLKDKLFK